MKNLLAKSRSLLHQANLKFHDIGFLRCKKKNPQKYWLMLPNNMNIPYLQDHKIKEILGSLYHPHQHFF